MLNWRKTVRETHKMMIVSDNSLMEITMKHIERVEKRERERERERDV